MPISFDTYSILEDNRNIDIHKDNDGKYLIQTHPQAKTSSTKLPEVHRVRKELSPNLRPEEQHPMPKKGISKKPWEGQGRADSEEEGLSLTASIRLQRCDMRNSRRIQNRNRENKQLTRYKQCT